MVICVLMGPATARAARICKLAVKIDNLDLH
jgi:hypothetical protein